MSDLNLNMLATLEPEAIVKLYKSKGYKFSWNWKDTWQESNAKAFTVAKAMKLDILQSIGEEVNKTFTNGNTYSEFQKNLEPTLKKLGWWGKVPAKDVPGYNPEIVKVDPNKMVQLGSPRRLKTIYFTNANVGYNAGRWKSQYENRKERPYLRYNQVQRGSKRDEHSKYHHKVFRVDDSIWDVIYPPNGFHCGCYTNAMSEADIKSAKSKVSDGTKYKDDVVDNGWNYNPGKASFFPDLNKYDYNVAKQFVAGGLNSPDFNTFYNGKTKGNYPVAVLDEKYQKLIAAKTKAVLLSDESLTKNKKEHPELSIENYQNIPSLISEAQLIVKDKTNVLVFIKKNGNIFHSVIKATQNGEELYLTSFRTTSEEDVKRMKRKGEVIKDEM